MNTRFNEASAEAVDLHNQPTVRTGQRDTQRVGTLTDAELEAAVATSDVPADTGRRRRSNDPWFALWMLCGAVAERHELEAVVILDDFDNVIASSGNTSTAGILLLHARRTRDEQAFVAGVLGSVDQRALGGRTLAVARRFGFVHPRRDAFQVLVAGSDDAPVVSIAAEISASMKRILS